jgi:hypothetical protein
MKQPRTCRDNVEDVAVLKNFLQQNGGREFPAAELAIHTGVPKHRAGVLLRSEPDVETIPGRKRYYRIKPPRP